MFSNGSDETAVASLIRQLELLTNTAPLGLRFRDVVSGEFIGGGLNVTAHPAGNRRLHFPLLPNRSGVYVLHHVPGLRDFQQRAADQVWRSPLPSQAFIIEALDPEQRFLPVQLTINLPVKGIYSWTSPIGPSPPGPEAGIPLYPARARQAPAGMAVARAELFDLQTGNPAAWALIEAYFNNRLVARGIADQDGRLVSIFQYPAPRFSPLSSPIGSPVIGSVIPLHLQQWDLQLRAYYSPSLSPVADVSKPPELNELFSQRQTILWDDAAKTRQFTNANLQYGRDLILCSSEGSLSSPVSPPAKPSVLFITPA